MAIPSNSHIQYFDPDQTTTRQYWKFRNSLAASHPLVLHWSESKLRASLLRPKFQSAQRQFVVADSNQAWIGHVLARISPTLKWDDGSPLGMLGFFDTSNPSGNVTNLLQTACQWLRDQGCRSIVGPIDGDTWHSYRFNVGPHEAAPFLNEPTNPDYYPHLWTDAGFTVIDRYHSKVVDQIRDVLPHTEAAANKADEQGYQIRKLDLERFDHELDVLYELSKRVFCDNFLYDEISRDEFKGLYRSAKPLIHPNLVWFALDPENGKEIGFLFCIADYGPAVESMQGRDHLWAKFKFAWKRRSINTVNFKSIGVLAEHRRSCVAARLMHQCYVESIALGFNRANLCLIRDGNPSTRLDGGNSRIFRRYELYILKP